MDTMQHIWGLSFQDKSDCDGNMTTTLIQGMVGAYSLTEKYRNEIAKLRLKFERQDEALHDLKIRARTVPHYYPFFSDLLTNNTKCWNDDTKLLFVVVLDYGGPALLRII